MRIAGSWEKRKPTWKAIPYRSSTTPQNGKEYWAGTFVPAMFTERIYTPEQSEKNGKIVGADTIREAGCFSPDPDEHVKHARKYIDLGFDHLIFHSAGPDQQAFIEGYGRDVLPKLRARSKGSSKAAPRKRAAVKSKGR